MPRSVWMFSFRERESGELSEAVELYNRLRELGFPTPPDEEIEAMKQELKSRGLYFWENKL